MKRKVSILGINFDRVDLDEAIDKIREMIERDGCHQVGTVNPEYVVLAQDSKQLKRVIAKMDLVVPDGFGIILAAKIKNLGELNRIRGGELVEKIAEFCAQKGYKIALVGGEKGVAERALLALQGEFSNLRGFVERGPLHLRSGGRDVGRVEMLIEKERPKILLTALSFRGPIWIDYLFRRLRKKGISLVALEVGGVFNYLSGRAKKPPKIIQNIGLEWLWRLFWEPWRIRRQLNLIKFLWLIIRQN